MPSHGGPVWRAVESEHFTLWTDLPLTEARNELGHMEAFRHAMLDMVFKGAEALPSRSLVFAFRDHDDWRAFREEGRRTEGFFIAADRSPFHMPILCYPVQKERSGSINARTSLWEEGGNAHEIIQHELGHLVLDAVVHDAPAWLHEGVASYFQTAHIDDDGRVEIGWLPKNLVALIRSNGLDSIDEVVAAQPRNRHDPRFYLRSQILVSYLLNVHPERFGAYQRVLRQVPVDQHAQVWPRVFADYPSAKMEGEIDVWLREGTHKVFQLQAVAGGGEPRSRPLTDADVQAVRALMFAALGGESKRAQAVAAARAAVAADPGHLLGNVMLEDLGHAAEVHGTAVVSAHPDDYLAWVMLAASLPPGDEREQALRKACELAANEPSKKLQCDRGP